MSCSVTGPVRTRNEDRVLLATVCEIELLLVADGMGGHPRGDDAADIASTFALLALDRRLNELRDPTPQAVRAVLLETVWHVGGELARASPDPDSLRTTLIVVAVLKNAIVAAWIGDGAVSVARRDGTVIELLVPHREPSGLLNHVLHASLGPVVEGSPRWCIAMRQPGDLLIVATDGLADTRPADMVIQLRAAFNMPHREQALRDLIARWAIEARTDGEFLRTDNLTVAMHYDRAESMSP
jgi:protein phosphatase